MLSIDRPPLSSKLTKLFKEYMYQGVKESHKDTVAAVCTNGSLLDRDLVTAKAIEALQTRCHDQESCLRQPDYFDGALSCWK